MISSGVWGCAFCCIRPFVEERIAGVRPYKSHLSLLRWQGCRARPRLIPFPKLTRTGWYGLFAPKGTPKDIIGKLNMAAYAAPCGPTLLVTQGPQATFGPASDCRRKGYNLLALASFVLVHSALIPAPLMIGHHFSTSAFWKARSTSGVCCSRGTITWSRSARHARTLGSATLRQQQRSILR